jgi:hypothetical protein
MRNPNGRQSPPDEPDGEFEIDSMDPDELQDFERMAHDRIEQQEHRRLWSGRLE